nr:hypothetical protein CFP56_42067 [Quercus suber]
MARSGERDISQDEFGGGEGMDYYLGSGRGKEARDGREVPQTTLSCTPDLSARTPSPRASNAHQSIAPQGHMGAHPRHQRAHDQLRVGEDMSPPFKRRRLEDSGAPQSYVMPPQKCSARDPAPHFIHQVSSLPTHSLRPARIPSHVDEIHLRFDMRAALMDSPGHQLQKRQLGTASSSSSSSSLTSTETVSPLTNVNSITVAVAVGTTVDTGSTGTSSLVSSASETSSVESTRLSSSSDSSTTLVAGSISSSAAIVSTSRTGVEVSSETGTASSPISSSATNTGTSSATFATTASNVTTSATTITSGSTTFTSQTTIALSSFEFATDAAFVYLATLRDGTVQVITEYGQGYTTTFADGQVSTIPAASTTYRSTTTDASGAVSVFLLTASTEQSTINSAAAPVSAADTPTGAAGAGVDGASSSAPTSGTNSAAKSGDNNDSSTPPAATIAGGVVGGCAGLAALLLVAMLMLRWFRRRAQLGHQALPPNLAGPQGGLQDVDEPSAPRSAGMADRAGLVPLMGAIPTLLRSHQRKGAEAAPETSERSFQRVSGRKMPSAFSDGMQSPPPTAPLTSAGRDLSSTSFYRDSDGFYGGEGEVSGGAARVAGTPRSREEMTLSPGPRRTPTVHAAGPYNFSIPSRNVGHSPVGTAATYGSLDAPSSLDTNRNSRFTEEVTCDPVAEPSPQNAKEHIPTYTRTALRRGSETLSVQVLLLSGRRSPNTIIVARSDEFFLTKTSTVKEIGDYDIASSEARNIIKKRKMGNEQSQITVLRAKVSEVLPAYKAAAKDPQTQRYMNLKDREQFISALLVVLSNNAIRDLKDHQFALLYSRRPDAPDRVVARIVASKDGVIRAKAEATRGPGWEGSGRDHDEAFQVLKRYVEARLDEILQALPSDGQDAESREDVRMLGQVLGGGKSAEALDGQESVVDISVAGASQETLTVEPGTRTERRLPAADQIRDDDAPPAYDAPGHGRDDGNRSPPASDGVGCGISEGETGVSQGTIMMCHDAECHDAENNENCCGGCADMT